MSLRSDHPLYMLWASVKRRCNPNSPIHKNQRTYNNVSLDPRFESSDDFVRWADEQIGSDRWPEFHLDKDLLVPGNKVYGPDTCCFLPKAINSALGIVQSNSSSYPGVSFCKQTSRYMATIRIDGVKQFLGRFDTPEAAFGVYCAAKRGEVTTKASIWKEQLDPKVYQALLAFDPKQIIDSK